MVIIRFSVLFFETFVIKSLSIRDPLHFSLWMISRPLLKFRNHLNSIESHITFYPQTLQIYLRLLISLVFLAFKKRMRDRNLNAERYSFFKYFKRKTCRRYSTNLSKNKFMCLSMSHISKYAWVKSWLQYFHGEKNWNQNLLSIIYNKF